jgi:hypothetical protein
VTAIAPGGWAPYLDRDENLLWRGAPSTAPTARIPDVVLFATGLVLSWTGARHAIWPGFAEIRSFDAVVDPHSSQARLLVWGMLAVGLHLAFGRRIVSYLGRRGTRYALTDRRALIATSFLGRRLRSCPILAGTPVEFEPGTLSTIVFATDTGPDGERDVMRERIAFERIEDGERVWTLVRGVQAADASRPRGGAE